MGQVEVKSRKTGEREFLPLEGAAEVIRARILGEIEAFASS